MILLEQLIVILVVKKFSALWIQKMRATCPAHSP